MGNPQASGDNAGREGAGENQHDDGRDPPGSLRGIRGDDPDAPPLLAEHWIPRRIAIAMVRNRLSLTDKEAWEWLSAKWLDGRIKSTGGVRQARQAVIEAHARRERDAYREQHGLSPLPPRSANRGRELLERAGRGLDHFAEADLVAELDETVRLYKLLPHPGHAPVSPGSASPNSAASSVTAEEAGGDRGRQRRGRSPTWDWASIEVEAAAALREDPTIPPEAHCALVQAIALKQSGREPSRESARRLSKRIRDDARAANKSGDANK